MSKEVYYRPDTPRVIHETIDGEAVMIHMEKGHYYSMDRTGSAIWDLLVQGSSVSQLYAYLIENFAGDHNEIEQGLNQFLFELESEDLIVSSGPLPDSSRQPNDDITKSNGQEHDEEKPPFAQPELHKYTDMEDLLLLDPIHDVDETGWPAVPDDT